MKFSINKNILQSTLQEHSKVIPIRTTLPILSCAVLTIKEKNLTIKTSDLEQTIVSKTEIEKGTPGDVALPLNKLLEIVSALPDEEVCFSMNEDLLVEINNTRGTYKITGRDHADFPETPKVNKKETITLLGEEVLDIIGKTGYAVSRDDLKPALCGVYLNFNEKNLTAVATDGHKLVKYAQEIKQKAKTTTSLILPIKFLNILKDNINKKNNIEIDMGENHILTKQNNLVIISRIIKENFPDFNSVIPGDNKINIKLDAQPFINCIKRVSIFSNRTTKQIVLSFSEKGVVVSAQDVETSTSAKEHTECEFEGEEITTSYNAKYLVELLQHLGDQKIEMFLGSPLTAAVFKPTKNQQKLTALLMPMRTNQ